MKPGSRAEAQQVVRNIVWDGPYARTQLTIDSLAKDSSRPLDPREPELHTRINCVISNSF